MTDQVVIQKEPPWVVEIKGMKFVTSELVCLLLQDVSEERDQLKAENEKLKNYLVHRIGCETWDGKVCDCGLDAIKECFDETK